MPCAAPPTKPDATMNVYMNRFGEQAQCVTTETLLRSWPGPHGSFCSGLEPSRLEPVPSLPRQRFYQQRWNSPHRGNAPLGVFVRGRVRYLCGARSAGRDRRASFRAHDRSRLSLKPARCRHLGNEYIEPGIAQITPRLAAHSKPRIRDLNRNRSGRWVSSEKPTTAMRGEKSTENVLKHTLDRVS